MPLSGYKRFCHAKLGRAAKRSIAKKYDFRITLEQAHVEMLPETYIAYMWMSSIIAFVVSLVLAIVFYIILAAMGSSLLLKIIVLMLPLIITGCVYIGISSAPGIKAKARARNMDAVLPYAANFVSAMAAANATPQRIFRSLGLQENIYGEISKEASAIYRDITALGMDLITALKRAIDRSPSVKFGDFLQGMVSTLTAGGTLKAYFSERAGVYMRENRKEQEDFLETLSFMAESYVVVAVAMPIFLMIIMVIMYWVSGAGMQVSGLLLFLIVFVMLPVIHFGYIMGIYLMTPAM